MTIQHQSEQSHSGLTVPAMVEIQTANNLRILHTNLERIRTNDREYYDFPKDQNDSRQYYAEIDFARVDGQTLFRSLGRLLENTHRNRIKYAESNNYLKTWVDLHFDGTLRSLYSGKEADPQTVIEQDMQEMLEANVESPSGHSLNIEHVVPQSWFSNQDDSSNKKEPMRGDLHYLFYCEKDCNSFRGNKAYHDFPHFNPEIVTMERIRGECGMGEGRDGRDNGLFEPEYGKGLAARAMLYFLLRYPDKIEAEYQNKIDIELLLKWHTQFPPNLLFEKHRNQAIYEIQGNRNPLVDFPDYAKKIDFHLFKHLH